MDHFASVVGVWYQLEPVRLNWVNSPPLLMEQNFIQKSSKLCHH